ncbi:DUF2516 family protein [Specibacter sp. AOP5-B1-6]|uniref:DUF2516 family protein n=1 Tax=Specibacter sp. AOP5-B1-6 TaxID=3457653 RepID=UPI003FB70D04
MVIFLNFVQFLILVALGLVALGVQGWALSDCLRTPASDFERVYKRSKTFWTALTGGAFFFGIIYVLPPLMSLTVPPLGMSLILSLAGVTAAGVYLADVRPVLAEIRGRGKGQQNRGSSW